MSKYNKKAVPPEMAIHPEHTSCAADRIISGKMCGIIK